MKRPAPHSPNSCRGFVAATLFIRVGAAQHKGELLYLAVSYKEVFHLLGSYTHGNADDLDVSARLSEALAVFNTFIAILDFLVITSAALSLRAAF